MNCYYCENGSDGVCDDCGTDICDNHNLGNAKYTFNICPECFELREYSKNEFYEHIYNENLEQENKRQQKNDKRRDYYYSPKQVEKRRIKKELKKILKDLRLLDCLNRTAEFMSKLKY